MVMYSYYCTYFIVICYLVLDSALVGLSLAYGVSLPVTLQFVVRLSAEIENLVTRYVHNIYKCS